MDTASAQTTSDYVHPAGIGEAGWALVGAAILLAAILCALFACWCRLRHRRKKEGQARTGAELSMSSLPMVTVHSQHLHTPSSLAATLHDGTLAGQAAPPPASSSRSFSFTAPYSILKRAASSSARSARAGGASPQHATATKPPLHDPESGQMSGSAAADPFPVAPTAEQHRELSVGAGADAFAAGRVDPFPAVAAGEPLPEKKEALAVARPADESKEEKKEEKEAAVASAAAHDAEVDVEAAAAQGVFVDGLDYNNMMRI